MSVTMPTMMAHRPGPHETIANCPTRWASYCNSDKSLVKKMKLGILKQKLRNGY